MDKFTILQTIYGYQSFRKGQEELIDHVLNKEDVVGIMPTGAGKSICYQLPALLMEGVTLVISPLISLMQDQVTALTQLGVPAAFINSSLDVQAYKSILQGIQANKYRLLYIAPERLLIDSFLTLAKTMDIAMISVDEAHCISHWGQDFRPSYSKIPEFISQLPKRPIISAFTATATLQVKEDIIKLLRLHDPFTITTGFDRKNLYFEVRHPENKNAELCRLLQQYQNQSGIIYCTTRKTVEAVCTLLQSKGFQAGCYHAGLEDHVRKQVQSDFLYDNISIMVATNAFGMGIDKSNVSFVIHYNMPKDMESYYQEAGRAGRDGSNASCILFYEPSDVRMNQFLINVSSQNEELDEVLREEIKQRDLQRLKRMTFYCHSDECLRHDILQYFNEESDVYCGNCYNCNHKFEEVDITIEAQKICSCVKRMDERYGQTMVIDVLRGSQNARLLSLHLHQISTYGIMQDASAKRIRKIIQFLIYHDYLQSSGDEYPVLQLGRCAKELLIEKQQLFMKIAKEEKQSKVKGAIVQEDHQLMEALKELRAKLAKKQRVPAYIIFNDAALLDMCRILPKSEEEFLMVSGVGEAKLKRYGAAFLAVIQAHQ